MNVNLGKNIVWFLAGAVIGGITTKLVCEKAFEMKLEQMDLEMYEHAELKRRERGRGGDQNAYEDASVDDQYQKVSHDVLTRRYNKMAQKYSTSDERMGSAGDGPGVDPYVIDNQQFSDEMNDYEKLTIYYYAGDNVLANDDEEIISNMYHVLGYEFESNFDDITNVVYIRNETMETDYEVICLPGCHSEIDSGEGN